MGGGSRRLLPYRLSWFYDENSVYGRKRTGTHQLLLQLFRRNERRDTLYNDANTAFAESETVSISISCYEDENGNVDVRDPNQLKATLSGGGIRVSYYILFGKDNVKKSYISGYEEQKLRREINGITVHYSKIYDGSYHSQAKFIYDGDLYVIDVTSKEDIHDINNYIDRILKEE